MKGSVASDGTGERRKSRRSPFPPAESDLDGLIERVRGSGFLRAICRGRKAEIADFMKESRPKGPPGVSVVAEGLTGEEEEVLRGLAKKFEKEAFIKVGGAGNPPRAIFRASRCDPFIMRERGIRINIAYLRNPEGKTPSVSNWFPRPKKGLYFLRLKRAFGYGILSAAGYGECESSYCYLNRRVLEAPELLDFINRQKAPEICWQHYIEVV